MFLFLTNALLIFKYYSCMYFNRKSIYQYYNNLNHILFTKSMRCRYILILNWKKYFSSVIAEWENKLLSDTDVYTFDMLSLISFKKYQLYKMRHPTYHEFTSNHVTFMLPFELKNKEVHFLDFILTSFDTMFNRLY